MPGSSPLHLSQAVQYVHTLVETCDMHDELRALILQILARPGRILHRAGAAEWPALVLQVCHTFAGDPGAGAIAAAAVECAIAASDMIDDLLDEQWPAGSLEARRMLNASLMLNQLAQRCLQDLPARIGADRAQQVGALLTQGLLASCAGQDLDILHEANPDADEELAYTITQRKAGELVASVCRIGAALATDEAALLTLVGTFGFHVGVVAQLINDIAGVDPRVAARGSDLRLRKKTLPIAYALRCAANEGIPELLAWSAGTLPLTPDDELRIAVIMRDLGALHYTWILADAHRREALAILRALARATRRQEVNQLRRFIPSTQGHRV